MTLIIPSSSRRFHIHVAVQGLERLATKPHERQQNSGLYQTRALDLVLHFCSPDTVRQYEWTSSPGLGPLGQPTSTTMMTDRYSPRTRVAIGNQAKRLSTILTTQATHGASMEPIPTPASSRGQPDENCPPRDHVYRSLQDTSRPSRYIDQAPAVPSTRASSLMPSCDISGNPSSSEHGSVGKGPRACHVAAEGVREWLQRGEAGEERGSGWLWLW